jgi:hypothetical protein
MYILGWNRSWHPSISNRYQNTESCHIRLQRHKAFMRNQAESLEIRRSTRRIPNIETIVDLPPLEDSQSNNHCVVLHVPNSSLPHIYEMISGAVILYLLQVAFSRYTAIEMQKSLCDHVGPTEMNCLTNSHRKS